MYSDLVLNSLKLSTLISQYFAFKSFTSALNSSSDNLCLSVEFSVFSFFLSANSFGAVFLFTGSTSSSSSSSCSSSWSDNSKSSISISSRFSSCSQFMP